MKLRMQLVAYRLNKCDKFIIKLAMLVYSFISRFPRSFRDEKYSACLHFGITFLLNLINMVSAVLRLREIKYT